MAKLHVALLRGGPSKEHNVSLSSAESIRQHLDTNKYHIIDVFVDKSGQWSVDGGPKMTDDEAIAQLNCDVVFIGLHGTYGEDGAVQAKLEKAGLRFTGSDAKSSDSAFNKDKTQQLYEKHGILYPKYQVITNPDQNITLQLPFVVKPVAQGSSVGVSIVRDHKDVSKAINAAFAEDDSVMIQEFIAGDEVSCGVLESLKDPKELIALPPTSLIPVTADFFDYDAKYTVGATKEITPPDMPEELIERMKKLAVRAHQIVGCRGYSRTDMIIRNDDIFVIETNTLPGMTKTSILPQQAAAAGMSFAQLLDHIISVALSGSV